MNINTKSHLSRFGSQPENKFDLSKPQFGNIKTRNVKYSTQRRIEQNRNIMILPHFKFKQLSYQRENISSALIKPVWSNVITPRYTQEQNSIIKQKLKEYDKFDKEKY